MIPSPGPSPKRSTIRPPGKRSRARHPADEAGSLAVGSQVECKREVEQVALNGKHERFSGASDHSGECDRATRHRVAFDHLPRGDDFGGALAAKVVEQVVAVPAGLSEAHLGKPRVYLGGASIAVDGARGHECCVGDQFVSDDGFRDLCLGGAPRLEQHRSTVPAAVASLRVGDPRNRAGRDAAHAKACLPNEACGVSSATL